MTDDRLESVEIDPGSLPAANDEVTRDRQRAIADLIAAGGFRPEGAEAGPFALRLSLQDAKLALLVTGPHYERGHLVSLTPLKPVIRDYRMICESYHEALRGASASRIESVDMGRRGLHNEGAEAVKSRLAGKIALEHEAARKLFTLLVAVTRKA